MFYLNFFEFFVHVVQKMKKIIKNKKIKEVKNTIKKRKRVNSCVYKKKLKIKKKKKSKTHLWLEKCITLTPDIIWTHTCVIVIYIYI